MTSTKQTVICEEIFDDTSHPSITEIREYASKIGIDPDSEPQLLPLAAEGLMKPLPPTWKPCYDDKRKAYYYHNHGSGKTQWEHPLDHVYRDLVTKVRTESQSLSFGEQTEDATYTRDDLPSYEEPFPLPRHDIKLSPLKTRPKLGDISKFTESNVASLSKQKSEDRPSVSGKINLSLFSSFDETNLKGKKISPMADKQELKVSGGGSMFLKSNTKKQGDVVAKANIVKEAEESSYDALKSVEIDNKDDVGGSSYTKKPESNLCGNSDSNNIDNGEDDSASFLKSYFNKQNSLTLKPLGTVTDSKSYLHENSDSEIDKEDIFLKRTKRVTDSDAKPSLRSILRDNPDSDKLDKEDDDRKSVRFNMETNPNMYFSMSDDSETESNKNDDTLLKVRPVTKSRFTVTPVEEKINPPSKADSEFTTEMFFKKLSKHDKLKPGKDAGAEVIKKDLLNESEKTIQNYKDELLKSQQEELETILTAEKEDYKKRMVTEVENLNKDMQTHLNATITEERLKFELQLENKKQELQKHYENEERNFEQSLMSKFESKTQELEKMHAEKLAKVERDLEEKLEKHKDELIVSHNAILDQIKQNHSAILDELHKDYKSEEDIIRREHHKQISDLRNKVTKEVDAEKICTKDVEDERLYEKVRCEKRLLEDKYRCLKDKYLKLKTEVKLSIEKRNRKKEQNLTTTTNTTTTGSETEKSPSEKKER